MLFQQVIQGIKMYKFIIAAILIAFTHNLPASAETPGNTQDSDTQIQYSYPKDPAQLRRERRSGAYNKTINQFAEKPDTSLNGVDCYYRMSGCSEEQLEKEGGVPGGEYKESLYPKEGYMLTTKGTYQFRPGAQSRN